MEDTICCIEEMIEMLTTALRNEIDNGVDKVDTCEAGHVADIIKDLAEARYYISNKKSVGLV